jgi:(R,R)-butanediol dehydrogenase/meso-butanediol dehydrogenase/diacetyl reductase
MKAAVFKEARKMVVEEVPDPIAGAGEVVVKVKHSGICGSDLHIYQYGFAEGDTIMGHEATGIVASVGDGVTHRKEGDRVLVRDTPCGECERCLKYNNNFCENPITATGAYAEYFKVPARFLEPLADDIGMREAALMDPLGCAHHAVARAKMHPGETVLVIGGGPIGLFVIQRLKDIGVEQIILSEPVKPRAKLAVELGADVILDPTAVSIDEEVMKLTDRLGPEVVFECVGIPSTTLDSTAIVRKNGRVVWVGVCMEEVSFWPMAWNLKNISVEAIMDWGSDEKVRDYLKFIRDKQDDISKIITDIISLDELPDAFEKLLQPNTEAKVMVEFDGIDS